MNPSIGNGFDNVGLGMANNYDASSGVVSVPGVSVKQKKNIKPIVISLMVVLVIIVTVLMVWLIGFGGLKNLQEDRLRASFNEYVNYVTLGENSNKDFDLAVLNEAPFFSKLNENQLENYFLSANEKYDIFRKIYYENGEDKSIDLLKAFYQDLPKIKIAEKHLNDNLLSIYLESGSSGVYEIIDDVISNDVDVYYLTKDMSILKKINELKISIIEKNGGRNCFVENGLAEDCQNISSDDMNELLELLLEEKECEVDLWEKVASIILEVRNELYDLNTNKGEKNV